MQYQNIQTRDLEDGIITTFDMTLDLERRVKSNMSGEGAAKLYDVKLPVGSCNNNSDNNNHCYNAKQLHL